MEEIERWRDLLARNFALRNQGLSQRELNFAVQQTIDRIIFLRICEDRGIEKYGRLMECGGLPPRFRAGEPPHSNGATVEGSVYSRLFELFRKADEKYNSGLFHFKAEKGRLDTDALTPNLAVDDKVLKDIFKNLYYPDSPYEFSVLSADILGQVYEKFLGKVITLTNGHQAKIEEKPEVRKAGGVYYTPTYIVDYIVKNTVGSLLENKKPGPRGGAARLKILDPACGSGSFLIGAYQYLLDWHLEQYLQDGAEKWTTGKTPRLYQTGKGDWRLTTDERKRILLNNIYGVDIDPQAVEVTKLSLLLKVLEGETEKGLVKQMLLFQERVLPDLANNIKCGNSLIGPDYYDHHQMTMFCEDDLMRVNAFDWNREFADIMQDGGFDAVIGNPPYGANFSKNDLQYIRAKYQTIKGELDSYLLFIVKSMSILNHNGLFSMIIPDTWLTLINASDFREWILKKFSLLKLLALNEFIFQSVTVDPLIILMQKTLPLAKHAVTIGTAHKKEKIANVDILEKDSIEQNKWLLEKSAQIKIYMTFNHEQIANQIKKNAICLEEIIEYKSGCKPYEVGKGFPPQTEEIVSQKPFTSGNQEQIDWKKLIRGNDVQRYFVKIKKPEWIKYGKWLAAPRDPKIFEGDRILVQAIRNPSLDRRIVASFTNEQIITRINVYSLKNKSTSEVNLLYILGIMNSNLMNWYLKKNYGLHTYVITGILQIPIKKINFADSSDQKNYNQILKTVNQVIELYEQLDECNIPQAKTVLKRQIETTDNQINQLVYQLYGLTAEEIQIIESEVG